MAMASILREASVAYNSHPPPKNGPVITHQ